MPPPPMNPNFLIVEFSIALVAVILCILIYFKTKEAYSLTKHEGIKYFRDAFLFLGFAYILRFIFMAMMLSATIFDVFLPKNQFFPISMMLTGYFSTIGLIYLIFSSAWKYMKKKYVLALSHILAVAASIVAFITRSSMILLAIQIALIVVFIVATILLSKKTESQSKKLTKVKFLYLLVGLLWLINLFTAGRPIFLREIDASFQVIALAVFFIIYIKVSKWV